MKFFRKRLFLLPLIIFSALLIFSVLLFIPKKSVSGQEETSFSLLVDNNYFSVGSLASIPSTQQPVVTIQSYTTKESGAANVYLYQTDESFLLNSFVHDKDNKRLSKTLDFSKLQQVANQTINISTGNQENNISLPLEQSGIWVLRIDFLNKTNYFFLIRSDNGVIAKEGDKEYIFWAQNFKSKRTALGGNIKLYSLEGGVRELSSTNFNNEGIAKTALLANADIAIAKFDKDLALIPLNLRYIDTSFIYKSFARPASKKYFIFTDRPIYKPGDTLYFKAIIRNDEDAYYTKAKGIAKVSINKDYDEPVVEKEFPISSDGSVFGEYKISKDSPAGYYSLKITTPKAEEDFSQTAGFQIQNYRKPEYSINVTTDKTELISKDKSSVKVSSEYFFGMPVANQKIKYKILSSNYSDYEFYSEKSQAPSDDYFYSYWGAEKIAEGQTFLDKKGQAQIPFDAKILPDTPPTDNSFYEPHFGRNQVFSIQVTLDDGTGNPSFSKKNVLVYAGEFDIFRKEGNSQSKINQQISLPVILVPHFKAQVSNINLVAKIHRENWFLDENQKDSKYPQYKKEEEDLPQISLVSDKDGNANISFTPQKIGYYTFTVNGTDKRGSFVSKDFHIYVTSDTQNYNFSNNSSKITVSSNKDKYQPSETAQVTVSSEIPDTDVFLAVERGRVRRFNILHLQGKSQTINLPLEDGDIPNVFADASAFLSNSFTSSSKKLSVSTQSKILKLDIKTDKQKYGPGDSVQLNINATDHLGNPVSTDTALWVLDKSLLELSDYYNPDIITYFWQERYDTTAGSHSLEGITQLGGGGGCFSADTNILLADKKSKRIDQINVGEKVLTQDQQGKLTESKVLAIHKAKVDGYLIINTSLKVTPNHKVFVNGAWKQAGSIQIGDKLKDLSGKDISVSSIQWQKGSFEVYNLEVDKTHTFFANSILVHNDKGIDREVFKDLAYWNPSIHTDSSGHAQITFQLPDNLTTWVILTISSTDDTKVGQQKKEIIVQKDVFIRPILPNILRVGDQAILSAIVHNFTNHNQDLEVSLQTDSLLKQNLSEKQKISITPSDFTQVFYPVTAQSETEGSKLIFVVKSSKDQKVLDSETVQLPIRPFEFLEKQVFVGQGSVNFPIQISEDASKDKGNITLTLSPTLLGSVFDSMKYLIDYAYGCAEQTVSRLVPALITKIDPLYFKPFQNMDDTIQKSLSRLDSLQHPDGSFSWWRYGQANYFVTAYSVENLIIAKNLGYKVSDGILKRAKGFLETDMENLDYKSQIERVYALSLMGSEKGKILLNQFDNLSPDILSWAILANIQNGFKDPQTNGLSKLLSLKKTLGDDVYFDSGDEKDFGSQEASTALAIRAMLAGGGNDQDIVASVRFLTRNRKNEYFANTFATAQVIKALVEFSKDFKEKNPNFSYDVSLERKQLAKGVIQDIQAEIPKITLQLSEIKSPAEIKISQNGSGQLYSNLTLETYNKNRNAKALNQGFSVERGYENTNGRKDIQVGDIVNVKITVSGQDAKNYYALIKDELPAGLVPVNIALSNEQYFFDEPQMQASPVPYSVTDTETTENGMILSIYQMNSGTSTFTYKARAVSEGKFIAPPAQVELMYNPKVYGRSDVATLDIRGVSKIDQAKDNLLRFIQNYKILVMTLAVAAVISGILIYRRQKGI